MNLGLEKWSEDACFSNVRGKICRNLSKPKATAASILYILLLCSVGIWGATCCACGWNLSQSSQRPFSLAFTHTLSLLFLRYIIATTLSLSPIRGPTEVVIVSSLLNLTCASSVNFRCAYMSLIWVSWFRGFSTVCKTIMSFLIWMRLWFSLFDLCFFFFWGIICWSVVLPSRRAYSKLFIQHLEMGEQFPLRACVCWRYMWAVSQLVVEVDITCNFCLVLVLRWQCRHARGGLNGYLYWHIYIYEIRFGY